MAPGMGRRGVGGREGCSGDEEERSSEVMFWGMLKKRRDGAPRGFMWRCE